ncbi:MAG: DUF1553 domain-containing protein [Bryobacteraceae bacterium]
MQKYLFGKFNKELAIAPKDVAKVLSAGDKASIDKMDGEVAALEAKKKKLEKIQALWDVGTPPVIRLLQRGSADAPGPRVKPGFPEILSDAAHRDAVKPDAARGETSGMRLALAEWLTGSDHPLTARVIVNRIWQGHFGTGIVATPDNFGATGAGPTNQELLDWLAVDFVKNGWKAKRLRQARS